MDQFFYGFSGVVVLFFGGLILLAPVLAISIRIGFQPFAKRFDAWLEANAEELSTLHVRLMEAEAKLEQLRSAVPPERTTAMRVRATLDRDEPPGVA
jgi:hypothetical protein